MASTTSTIASGRQAVASSTSDNGSTTAGSVGCPVPWAGRASTGTGAVGPRQGGGEAQCRAHQQELDTGQPEERVAVPVAGQACDRRTPVEVSQQPQHQERGHLGRHERAVAGGPRTARGPQPLGDRDQPRAGEREVGTQGQGTEACHGAGQEDRLAADVEDQSQQPAGPQADCHDVDHEGRHHDVVSRCRGGVPGHGAGQQPGHRDHQQHPHAGGRARRPGPRRRRRRPGPPSGTGRCLAGWRPPPRPSRHRPASPVPQRRPRSSGPARRRSAPPTRWPSARRRTRRAGRSRRDHRPAVRGGGLRRRRATRPCPPPPAWRAGTRPEAPSR